MKHLTVIAIAFAFLGIFVGTTQLVETGRTDVLLRSMGSLILLCFISSLIDWSE